MMDNFSKVCAAILLLLMLAAGAVALDAKAEDYTPEEPAQQEEQQEQAPSIDTSGYVQVADPALYAKLDTMQETLDKLADALAPDASAEDVNDAPAQEQAPAPDYTAQLSGISAQLADMAQQATAETAAEDVDPFQKPFADYSTGETLALIGVVLLLVFGIFSLLKNFVL